MPHPRHVWRHVIVNTKGSWLHGDPRGFRSRDHRIHSSGDYKNPPPAGEHAGLHRHEEGLCPESVGIQASLRGRMAFAFRDSLRQQGFRVLVVSCSGSHLHALVELPKSRSETKRIVGEAKRIASRSVKREMPGSVWLAGGTYKPCNSRSHQRRVFKYIRDRQEEGAFVWHFRMRES